MRKDARAARAAEIETAAYGVLEKKGYAGLSMLAVAKAARASNETLYRWYGDKNGLLEALIAGNADLVATALGSLGPDPLRDLARVGPVLLDMLLGERAIALNRAAAADASGALGALLAQTGRDRVKPRISAVIQAAIARGQLKGDADDLTELYLTLLIGDLQIRRVTGALPPLSPQSINDRAARALTLLRQLPV